MKPEDTTKDGKTKTHGIGGFFIGHEWDLKDISTYLGELQYFMNLTSEIPN